MTNFKVGDRVVYEATDKVIHHPQFNGATGTVVNFDTSEGRTRKEAGIVVDWDNWDLRFDPDASVPVRVVLPGNLRLVERPGTTSEEEVDWKARYEVAEERFQIAQGYADDRALENGELREQLEEAQKGLEATRKNNLDHLTAEGELIEELGVMVEKLDKAEEINEVLIEEIESLHSVIVQLTKDRYLG